MLNGSKLQVEATLSLVNPQCNVDVKLIGWDQAPLIIIEECWRDPNSLVNLAGELDGFIADPEDFYPGLRNPLSDEIREQLCSELLVLMNRVLTPKLASMEIDFCAFSLTNKKPEELIPIQRIPHFDSTSSLQFALVGYLFEGDKGGTSFYRHKKTGFEIIDEDRANAYMKNLQTQASTVGLPDASYINGSTQLFERFHSEEANFNKCILYPANLLHSGNISAANSLSDSPLDGRLTINACLDIALQ